MAHRSEHHRESSPICCVDHLSIAHGTAGLNYRRRARVGDCCKSIGKGKERVRGSDGPGERKHSFHRAEPRGIHTRHLPGADAKGLGEAEMGAGVDDCVGFYVFCDAPGEQKGLEFVGCGVPLGDGFQVGRGGPGEVSVLYEESAGDLL